MRNGHRPRPACMRHTTAISADAARVGGAGSLTSQSEVGSRAAGVGRSANVALPARSAPAGAPRRAAPVAEVARPG